MAAQETQPTAAAAETPGPVPYELSSEKMLSDTLIFLVLLFAIFYFILIRPQQKRIKEHDRMLNEIRKGSRVLTGGGILGTVVKTDGDDVLVVEIAPEVKVRVARATITEVMKDGKETANDN